MCHVYYTRGLRFREDGLRLRAAGLIFACKRPYRNGIYKVKNKMKKNYIYACVEELIEKYNTSDPFELMDALDIHCESSNLEHLKGYCVIIHGIKFIAINENLRPAERKIVAAHELGHIILHSDKLKAAAHEDMNIYNIADKTEYQANLFAADLLLDDDEVDELAMQEGIDFYTMARYLYTNPQLLGFKLFSMANRGYNYNFHIPPKSTFLA